MMRWIVMVLLIAGVAFAAEKKDEKGETKPEIKPKF